MLPRRHRIAPRSELLATLRRGYAIRGGGLVVRILPTRRPVSRFAFIVSTKVSKKATVRNRLRRQISAAAQALVPRLTVGYDVVVTILPSRGPSAAALTAALAHSLRRGRLIVSHDSPPLRHS
jgi:ribonuclease P protein component